MVEYAVVLQTNPDPNLNFVLGLDSPANIQRPYPVIGDKEVFRKQLQDQMKDQGIECMIIIGTKKFLLENPFHLSEEDFVNESPIFSDVSRIDPGPPWYGYIHVDGTLHVKRYFGPEDITEATDSEFVAQITGPFHAPNAEIAATLANHRFAKGSY